jgi:hypothetical protein
LLAYLLEFPITIDERADESADVIPTYMSRRRYEMSHTRAQSSMELPSENADAFLKDATFQRAYRFSPRLASPVIYLLDSPLRAWTSAPSTHLRHYTSFDLSIFSLGPESERNLGPGCVWLTRLRPLTAHHTDTLHLTPDRSVRIVMHYKMHYCTPLPAASS